VTAARPRRAAAAPYLLDTHIWIWYLGEYGELPAGLRAALDEAQGELWFSPISVWELCLLHERRRVELDDEPRPWVEDAMRRLPLKEAPVTREVALVSRELELPHRDPADRFLAASALVYELTLVTLDERLRAATWLPTRSA
jgi:PIN domain nuclease of toxin-antitoxin system